VVSPDEFREKTMLVGYAKVSTREQNHALQLDASKAAGALGARRVVSRPMD
jgi:DNA invertase Pin-like site-specific DNA recombinase